MAQMEFIDLIIQTLYWMLKDLPRLHADTFISWFYKFQISEEVICEANHKHSVRNVISLFGIVTVVGSTVFLSSVVQ